MARRQSKRDPGAATAMVAYGASTVLTTRTWLIKETVIVRAFCVFSFFLNIVAFYLDILFNMLIPLPEYRLLKQLNKNE